jgi:glucose/arabinose dehydrogenase
LFVACGGGDDEGGGAAPTATLIVSQGRGEPIVSASDPVAFAVAPDGRLFFTERTKGEIRTVSLGSSRAVSPDQLDLPPVQAARTDLAGRIGVPDDEIAVTVVTAMDWPDACLGLGEAGEACAAVVTPGYEVALSTADGRSYSYRTDAGQQVRLAELDTVATGDLFAAVDVFQGDECGLLGIAIDPDFAQTRHVYVYATQPVRGRDNVGRPRIIRYRDVDGQGLEPTVIVDNLPETNPRTCAHVSGNLHFGPDGHLYVSVGNFEMPETAADLSSPLGKILRLNKDGSAAPGNPFAGQSNADARVFAYGLRNPFDFAFHPETGALYAPDNGPGNCDELNIIEAGADYGVPRSLPLPDVESCLGLGGTDPIHLFAQPDMTAEEFGSNVAPAGVAFTGDGLLVCEFNTGFLRLLQLQEPGYTTVGGEVLVNQDCRFNVEVAPDGAIYYSNREGIFRLAESSPDALPATMERAP